MAPVTFAPAGAMTPSAEFLFSFFQILRILEDAMKQFEMYTSVPGEKI